MNTPVIHLNFTKKCSQITILNEKESDLITWIIQSLASWVLAIVSAVFSIISAQFSTAMALKGDETLDLFFNLFIPAAKEGHYGNDTDLWTIMLACGLFVLYAIFLFQVFKAFFGPLTKAESPIKLLGKTLFFSILVVGSRSICGLFFTLGTAPYDLIKNATIGSNVTDLGDALQAAITNGLTGIISSFTGVSAIESVLSIIIIFAILVNYLKLIIEIAERYVILGVLSLFSPVCIATGASESTDNIFKSWVRMMVSQCILMCMSVLFLRVFSVAVFNISSVSDPSLSYTPFMGMVLILAWLRTGQRIDSHMSTLGLTTAQAGNGLYADMMAGMKTASMALGAANKAATIGTGVAAAGGLKAYAASNEGGRVFGRGAQRLAQNSSNNADKIKTSAFNARETGFDRGHTAMEAFKAKYGDNPAIAKNLEKGHQMLGAEMSANGGVASMIDENGKAYRITCGDTENGGFGVSIKGEDDDHTAALQGIDKPEGGAEDVANATNGGMPPQQNGMEITDEDNNKFEIDPDTGIAAIDGNGDAQDVSDSFNADGMAQAGETVYDDEGRAIGTTTGGTEMSAEGADDALVAQDQSGQETNIAGQMNADGSFNTDGEGNIAGTAVKAEGVDGVKAAMTDENGNAHTIENAMNEDGSVNQDAINSGAAVQAADGTIIPESDLNATAMAMGEDGQLHDVSNLVDENGQLKDGVVDENGNITTADGHTMSADSFEAKMMAEGADGQLHDVTDSVGFDGQIKDGADIGPTLQTDDGTNMAAGLAAATPMAIGDDGMAHDVSNLVDENGQLKDGVVDENGNVTASDGYTMSASDFNATMMAPDSQGGWHDVSNAVGFDGKLKDGVATGATMKADDGTVVSANAGSAKAMATGSDGKLHDVSNLVDNNGNLKSGAIDSHGNVTTADGHTMSASGFKATMMAPDAQGNMHNVSNSVGFDGSFKQAASAVPTIKANDGSTVSLGSARAGAMGADGKLHDISHAYNSDGTLKSSAVDSSGNIKAADGTKISTAGGLQPTMMAQDASGNWHDVSNSVGLTGVKDGVDIGSSYKTDSGYVDASKGNPSPGAQVSYGQFMTNDGASINAPHASAIGSDGQRHDVSAGMNVDGSAKAGVGASFTASDGTSFTTSNLTSGDSTRSASTVGNYAKGADGVSHSIQGSLVNGGGAIAQSAISTDSDGSRYITSDDGVKIPLDNNNNVSGGYQTYSTANGNIQTAAGMQSISAGRASGQLLASVPEGTSTYNVGGSKAMSTSGSMVDISGYADSQGNLTEKGRNSVRNGALDIGGGQSVKLNSSGGINTFSEASDNRGSYVPIATAGGGMAMARTDGQGHAVLSKPAVDYGSVSFSGSNPAMNASLSHSYSSAGQFGDYVKSDKGGTFKPLAENGGRSANGGVQYYSKSSSGAYEQISNPSSYDGDKYAKVSNGDGTTSFMNVGKNPQSYSQQSFFGGIPVNKTTDSQGNTSFSIPITQATHMSQADTGVTQITFSNGQSVYAFDKAMWAAPENAVSTVINGREKFCIPASSVASSIASSTGQTSVTDSKSIERIMGGFDGQTRTSMRSTSTGSGKGFSEYDVQAIHTSGDTAIFVSKTRAKDREGNYMYDKNNNPLYEARTVIPKSTTSATEGKYGYSEGKFNGMDARIIKTYCTASGGSARFDTDAKITTHASKVPVAAINKTGAVRGIYTKHGASSSREDSRVENMRAFTQRKRVEDGEVSAIRGKKDK